MSDRDDRPEARSTSFDDFDRSLAGNIIKVSHLTVNVSDLDRSVEFYEKAYPVTRAETIEMDAQPLLGLGVAQGRFRARMMRDAQTFQGRGLLLVQWLHPSPSGVPYRSANNIGYYRHHAQASRTGLQARYDDVVAAGGRPYGPPRSIEIAPGLVINAFGFRDPDGTTLEWIGPMEPNPEAPVDFLSAYNANCRDLPSAHAWYRRVLGLRYTARLNAPHPQPMSCGSLGDSLQNPDGSSYDGLMAFDATILNPWPDGRNAVDLLEWTMPAPFGDAYADATNLGTQSVTYEVNDVDHVQHKLVRLLDEPQRHIVHGVEEWDLGELGRRRVLNIVDPDGIRIQFMQVARTAPADPA